MVALYVTVNLPKHHPFVSSSECPVCNSSEKVLHGYCTCTSAPTLAQKRIELFRPFQKAARMQILRSSTESDADAEVALAASDRTDRLGSH